MRPAAGDPKAILVIRRDNIGDLICTTPLFAALRQRFPNTYLAALVNSYNEPAIQGNPHLDAVFSYTKGKHSVDEPIWRAYLRRAKLLWQLRRMRFDYVVLATGGVAFRSLKFARMLRPRQVIGFVTEAVRPSGISLPLSHQGGERLHETEDIFRLLEPLGISGEIPGLTVVADTGKATALRTTLPDSVGFGGGPLVALHISARKEKQRWPIERFADLAHHLRVSHAARFLIFWSPGEENNPFHPGDDSKAKQLVSLMANLPVAPIPTVHLSELMAGLSLCDVAVLSDGGAMHIAAGLGKPLVCFFGNSSAARWHPWKVPYELLQKPSRDVSDISVGETADAFSRLMPTSINFQRPHHLGVGELMTNHCGHPGSKDSA